MAINAKRLLKLADYLETVPRKQFNMATWGQEQECGFAGCAIGWAIHSKLFRGFTFTRSNWPQIEDITGFPAIATVFKIQQSDAIELFATRRNEGGFVLDETPKKIAKRIRKFVRDHQATP